MSYSKRLGPVVCAVAAVLLVVGCRQGVQGTRIGTTYEKIGRPEVWRVPVRSEAGRIALLPGDVIIAYGDVPVETQGELLAAIAGESQPGTASVELDVMRDEQERSISARPGPLGYVPSALRYSGSLALALEDITAHFGRTYYYDWLAALTGESFCITGRMNDCLSWWPGGTDGIYLDEIGKLLGLSFRSLYEVEPTETAAADTAATPADTAKHEPVLLSPAAIAAIRDGLAKGQLVLVRGRWSEEYGPLWGIATRFDPADSTVYGYSVGSSTEQPLRSDVLDVYEVKARHAVELDPSDMLTMALDHALELGLAEADTGWKSGLDAYDGLYMSLDTVPFCADRPEKGQASFERLLWAMLGCREAANSFLIDMKEALPEDADLLDEVTAGNRVVIGKLEGLFQTGLRLDSREDRARVQAVITEIQLVENDLLGFYEELIGEI